MGTDPLDVQAPPLDPTLASLPPPDQNATVTRLLGVPASDSHATLIELYARQIAAIVLARAGEAEVGAKESSEDEEAPAWDGRSVVVGLSLKRSPADEDAIDDQVRATFAGVMQMVLETRVW